MDFVTFSLWNVSWPKSVIPDEKLSLKILSSKSFFSRYIDVCNKSSRVTFHYVIIAMISEFQNDFNDHLKYNAYKNVFSSLFHRIHFNRSWKNQNINWEKHWRGKVLKTLIKFPHFSVSKNFLRQGFPQ